MSAGKGYRNRSANYNYYNSEYWVELKKRKMLTTNTSSVNISSNIKKRRIK